MLSLAAWLLAAPVIFMYSVFVAELVAGLLPARRRQPPETTARVAVIVPAHDEAEGVGATITALVADLPAGARLLVVADNCSDATAAIARAAGADVVERTDRDRRGKGYALAFARDALAASPPDCVVVLDADCRAEPGAIARLRDAVTAWQVPVQATNLLAADLAAPPMVQISNFAFMVKNLVRQRGAARLGAAAMLGGTGMALPWPVFASAPLASSDLVEDLSLGLSATRSGRPPRFLEVARVTSGAASESATLTQRTRWEHGFVATARRHALPMLADAVVQRRWPQFWAALHLCVPPLAMLTLMGGAVLAVLLVIAVAGGVWAPAATLFAIMAVGIALVVVAWARWGRPYLSAGSLLRLPFYVLWKLPIYLKLVRKPETSWVRTERLGE